MLISHSHRFIFFHIPKTGGLSVRAALEPWCAEPERFKMARPLPHVDGAPNPIYEVWRSLLLHARAEDARRELDPAVFERYFKFAFLRNPWDWHVSMYHFILGQPTHVRHAHVRALGSFSAYLQWVVETPRPFPKGATRTQAEIVSDRQGRLLVDYLGRYDRLEQDFAQVCGRLGLRSQLPHLNRSAHQGAADYYDDASRRLVAEHFERDIELGSFSFGDLTPPGSP